LAIRSKDVSAIYELLYNPNFIPRRSPDAHIEPLTIDGRATFVLIKESEHEDYEVDDDTNAVWQLLDGNRTVKELVADAAIANPSLTEKDVKDIVATLAEEGAIETSEAEVEKKRVEVESAFQVNVNVVEDSSKSLAGLYKITRKLIGRWELYVTLGISVVGAVLFSEKFVQIFSSPTVLAFAGSTLLGYFVYQMVILLPVYAVHEVAHGAVCDYYGAKPGGIGTGLYYLAPFFYCDTSAAWRLPRRARIMISVAGPLSELTISSAFVFASFFVAPGFLKNVLYVGAFLGYYGSLINFSPIVETDGYYILTDILDIPNLRDETFSFIKKGILGALGRPVSRVRRSARMKRIFALYSLIMFGWLAFFGYTTVHLFAIYGGDAYGSLVSLGSTALGRSPLDPVSIGIDLATVGYFALLMGGFAVMGLVAYRKVHIRGKLETIHDKRVSVFMPVPSFINRKKASDLVRRSKSLARKHSRSFSVTLEPPFVVASLRLGRADETLEETRSSMVKVEQSFRSMHSSFLAGRAVSEDSLSGKKWIGEGMMALARQLSAEERGMAAAGATEYLLRREQALRTVLLSGFGTVWTLELSPEDYRRLRRQIFPALVAEDLGGAGLPPDLEAYKKRVVFGHEALAKLSLEIEEESGEVFGKPEIYQTAAFLEPIGSNLVFAGRTDKAEGSVVWIGGLFLYQAWMACILEALGEATVGLKSVRLLPSPLTRPQTAKLTDKELSSLVSDFAMMDSLQKAATDGTAKIMSTYQSATNFHEALQSLVTDEVFEVGLFMPILNANRKRLEGLGEALDLFEKEWAKTYDRFARSKGIVEEEISKRRTKPGAAREGTLPRAILRFRGAKPATPAFEREIKLMYTAGRLVYDVISASDLVM